MVNGAVKQDERKRANAEMVAGLGFHKAVTSQYATLDADVLPNKEEKRLRAEVAGA